MRLFLAMIILSVFLLGANNLMAESSPPLGSDPAEASPSSPQSPPPKSPEKGSPPAKKTPWTERIKVKGDFRYRYEFIDEEEKKPRHRNRVRARLAVEAKPEDWVKVCFGLATGSTDPVSTNQTLGDAFTTKNIRLDLAFAVLTPSLHEDFDVSVTAGKMKNPFHRPQKSSLLWDSDLRFEGGAVKVETEMRPLTLFAVAGAFWVLEHKADVDPALWALQGGAAWKLNDSSKLILGAGAFHYTRLRGAEVLVESDDAFGNRTTADAGGNLFYDTPFHLVEGFMEFSLKGDDFSVHVYGDVVINVGTTNDRMGFLAGVKVKGFGFTVGYDYRELEPNAVVGAFTDSDFAGGGTDGRGHRFTGKYALSKKVSLGLTYLINDKGLENEKAYHRVQADFAVKF